MVPHPQHCKIGCIIHGRDICVNQKCHLPYEIKPFKYEVMCDVSPLEVCDVIFIKTSKWKHHVVYESRPHSSIISLGKKLYRIPEALFATIVSLITAK